MKRPSPLAPVALLLATLGVVSCDSKPLGSVDGCTYNGSAYPTGVTFRSTDNCNTCSCQGGHAECTLVACVDASTDTTGGGTCFDSNGNQIMCTTIDAGAGDVRPTDGGTTEVGAKDGGGTCFDANGKTISCTTDAGVSCKYNGNVYMPGTLFACTDGCNTCGCASDGEITTTGKACADASPDLPATCFDASGNIYPCGSDAGVECLYNNKPYPVGASFPSSDGCNSCSCTAGGMIACTQKACADGAPPTDGPMCSDANGKIVPCPPDGGPAGVCMPGADQACNDDPRLSTLLGKCRSDYTCDCGSNTLNPMTGRCIAAAVTTSCSYNGTTYPLGSKLMCAIDAGCNNGVCVCATPGVVVPLCPDKPTPVCGFDAVYVYGLNGGLVTYTDEVTLTPPASYVLVHTPNPNVAAGAIGGSCGPALPACTSGPIDVSTIMRDIADPTVQLLLSLSTTQATFLGIDQRGVDAPAFSFRKSGTAGFLVGAQCNSDGTGVAGQPCTEVPGSVNTLMADLQKLDAQQRQDPSCLAFLKTM